MNRLAHSLKVTLVHWRLGAQYEMQYRLNFFLQIIQSGVRLVTGVVAIQIVFTYTTSLSGWTRPELLAVLGVHILLGGVMATFVLPNLFRFRYEVHEGELDFTLVRPVDSQMFVSTRQIGFWQLVDVAAGAIVLGWALTDMADRMTPARVALFGLALICGAIVIYSVWLAFTTTAFWLIDLQDADQLINGLYDAGRWPIRVYPFWLQGALTAVVPLGVAITVPAEALSGRLTVTAALILVAVTVVAVVGSRAFWHHGVKNYSGASA